MWACLIFIVLWLGFGLVTRAFLASRSNSRYSDLQLKLFVLYGFIWYIQVGNEVRDNLGRHTYPDVKWVKLPLTTEDKCNPFSEELKDALIHLRGLRGKPGEVAQRERERLARHVAHMREEPARLRQQRIDGYVVGMRPDYDALEARIKEKMELFQQVRQGALAEISNEGHVLGNEHLASEEGELELEEEA